MSDFGTEFENAWPLMDNHLADDITYIPVGSAGAGTTVRGVFNEFVGAIDDVSRAILTVSSDEVTSPARGDKFRVAGYLWRVIDIRSDNAGTHELRCDRSVQM